ncbi:hypothetical protein [Desmospora activa]|uniref:Uncharacterized protein n=1 Tax=Desmospora activa DSM 45169 TaxID=1121389 RepID=A0A2T4ZDA0_9BACL|nr:hypothetical protein [Desmospora activa]PTM59857.1 hypothetical protein C8J48_2492 [Desmospora activa DSM 45169]
MLLYELNFLQSDFGRTWSAQTWSKYRARQELERYLEGESQ